MVSHGRAFLVSAGWIVTPLAVLVLAALQMDTTGDWGGLARALLIAGCVLIALVALLVAALWVVIRARRSFSAGALGTQAGLLGLIVGVAAVIAYANANFA